VKPRYGESNYHLRKGGSSGSERRIRAVGGWEGERGGADSRCEVSSGVELGLTSPATYANSRGHCSCYEEIHPKPSSSREIFGHTSFASPPGQNRENGLWAAYDQSWPTIRSCVAQSGRLITKRPCKPQRCGRHNSAETISYPTTEPSRTKIQDDTGVQICIRIALDPYGTITKSKTLANDIRRTAAREAFRNGARTLTKPTTRTCRSHSHVRPRFEMKLYRRVPSETWRFRRSFVFFLFFF